MQCKSIISVFVILFQFSVAPAKAADDYYLQMNWNSANPIWKGLILTNSGKLPIGIHSVMFNGRDDCVVRPFKVAEMAQTVDRDSEYGFLVVIFSMASFETGSFLVSQDVLSPLNVQAQNEVLLKVGDNIAMAKPVTCNTLVRASVVTNVGQIDIEFNPLYEGP